MVVDITKSLVIPINILLSMKENNQDNVTTIKKVYNVSELCRELGGDHECMGEL